jgi:DNA-binding IclR family transcriptional regulator
LQPTIKHSSDGHFGPVISLGGSAARGAVVTSDVSRRANGRGPVGGAADRANEPDPLSVRALARGLSILSLFDVDHREWTIDEIAQRTGLLRMTAYRMGRTLESARFLIRDPVTNQYHLGPATLAMAYLSEDNSDFVDLARPFLESLVDETGESVTLAVEVDGDPVCVDIIDTTRPFQRQTAPGRIIEGLSSVHGKIFAAFKPEAERAAILAQRHPQATPYTVTDPQALAEELDSIIKEDLACDVEGLYLSTCAVGSPVRNQFGDVVAAISVVMPTGRFGPQERELCSDAVKCAATSLSTYLGWKSA